MNVTFEQATAADAQALVEVQIRAFHDDARLYGVEIGGPPGYDSLEEMDKTVAKPNCYKMVSDGKIIGGLVVFDCEEGHFHLDRIYIDPEYHNRGIGTQAMHFIEETFPAKLWSLDTPIWAVRNHHFYEKLGYVRLREFPGDGIILLYYEKQMTN